MRAGGGGGSWAGPATCRTSCEVTIFGNALHLLVKNEVSDPEIERDLEAAARAPVHIRPIDPSLEDVFVRLTRLQADAADAANAADIADIADKKRSAGVAA